MARSKAQDDYDLEVSGEGDDDSAGVDYEEGDGMVVDLSSTSDKITYPCFPRGIYDAELSEMEFTHSQRSNNPMWACRLELTDPKLAEQNKGKAPIVFLHLTFNEGGYPRVKQFLARIKCEDEANLELLKGRFSPAKIADEGVLIGARMRVKLDIRRYQGSNRNNVRDVLPPASSGGGSAFANL